MSPPQALPHRDFTTNYSQRPLSHDIFHFHSLSNNPLVKLFSRYHELTLPEIQTLKILLQDVSGRKRDQPKSINRGEMLKCSGRVHLLTQGCCFSYSNDSQGRCQILHISMAGELVGNGHKMQDNSSSGVECAAESRVLSFNAHKFFSILATSPRLYAVYLRITQQQLAIAEQRMINIGQKDCSERVAHFLLELRARQCVTFTGNKDEHYWAMPLNQQQLSNTLGMSTVHTGRIYRLLRESHIVKFSHCAFRILSLEKLVELAEFDSAYLEW